MSIPGKMSRRSSNAVVYHSLRIEIKYANEYLSWISMTEITGKYVFSVFSGKIVEILCMDYYRAYVFATLFQVVTILSYVGSTFEGRIVGNSVRAVSSHAT